MTTTEAEVPEVAVLRDTAEQATRLAGRVLMERFHRTRTVEFKGGIDLVTDADKASEQALLAFLRDRHPKHAVLSEESGVTEGEGVRWVVDPLDGTTNYAHQIPHFCVSVGAEAGGRLLAGAVYDPVREELFSAGRGQGTTLNGERIQASAVTQIQRAVLCTGFPYDIRERPGALMALFGRIVTQVQGVRRMGSAALDLSYVAAGRFDGFWEFGLKPWDLAAGALLVEEAEGVFSSIDGSPFHLGVSDVLACGRGLEAFLRREMGAY